VTALGQTAIWPHLGAPWRSPSTNQRGMVRMTNTFRCLLLYHHERRGGDVLHRPFLLLATAFCAGCAKFMAPWARWVHFSLNVSSFILAAYRDNLFTAHAGLRGGGMLRTSGLITRMRQLQPATAARQTSINRYCAPDDMARPTPRSLANLLHVYSCGGDNCCCTAGSRFLRVRMIG